MTARRLQTYATDDIIVTYDPARCIHAAECVRGLPDVFDPGVKRWIRPENAPAEAIAAVVARCPTGALRYRLRSGAEELAPADAVVRTARHGPLYVHGTVEVVLEDGETVTQDHRLALCRCGESANQPFCDGSHTRVGFRAW